MNNGKVSPSEAKDLITTPAPKAEPTGARRALGIIWDFWKAYAERIAFYQTSIILTLIYLLIAGPTWLFGRLTGQQFLPMGKPGTATFWREVQMGHQTSVEELQKQG